MICEHILAAYITFGLGYQIPTHDNTYQNGLGEVGVVAQCNLFYTEYKHISGIQVQETDNGLNAVMAGITFTLDDILTFKTAYGIQEQIKGKESNNYGKVLTETSIMLEWDGVYVKAEKLDSMGSFTFGLIKRF